MTESVGNDGAGGRPERAPSAPTSMPSNAVERSFPPSCEAPFLADDVPAPLQHAPPGGDAACRLDLAAIVVTYNRCALLTDLIDSLLRQTYPLRRIYVVDNASSDGTEAYGRHISSRCDRVRYLRSPVNTGGSGGFQMGVRAAFDAGHRWFWMMDDDVRAYPDAVAGLVPHLANAGCVHGRRRDFDGKPFFWQMRFSERLAMPVPVIGDVFRERSEYETNVGVFEGMLIERSVVERIGLPDHRFFITWDDAIYGWLASKVTRVLYVDHYVLERRRWQRQIDLVVRHLNDASDLYRYHTLRNRPLVREYVRGEGVYSPFWFAVGTVLIVLKEAVRLLVVQHEVRGFAALWHGWVAGRASEPSKRRRIVAGERAPGEST